MMIAEKNAYAAVAECPHLAPMAQPMRSKAAEKMELDSAKFDPSFKRPFVLNPKGYLGGCSGR